MPRLILHTGTPKTGSTAMQRFLLANREALAERKVALLDLALTGQGGHQPLLWALFNGGDHPDAVRQREALPAVLHEAREHGHDLIVSGEGFATANLAVGGAAAFERFRETCAEAGYEVETLTFVGDYAHVAAASYAQRAKTFQATRSFGEEVRAMNPRGAYVARHAEPIEALGVPSTFLPFDGPLRARGIEAALLDWLGIDGAGMSVPPRINERPGIVRVAAALALTERHLRTREIVVAQAARCGRAVEEACLAIAPDDPPYRPLTLTLSRWLDRTDGPGADAFAHRVWGRGWDDVFARDAAPRAATIDTADDPVRRAAQVAEVIAAAEPRVLQLLDDATWRERLPSSAVLPPRDRLRGYDVF